jgi:hypothetical protein
VVAVACLSHVCIIGDFVPTTDGAKVVCSIFIYFGVACIGLLLGSYIAAMLDESSRRAARENRIKSCPNCLRIQNIRVASERRRKQYKKDKTQQRHSPTGKVPTNGEQNFKRVKRSDSKEAYQELTQSEQLATIQPRWVRKKEYVELESNVSDLFHHTARQESLSIHTAPSTIEMLKRQSHSRHASMDTSNQNSIGLVGDMKVIPIRKLGADLGVLPASVHVTSTTPIPPSPLLTQYDDDSHARDPETDDDESSTSSSGSFSRSSESLDLGDQFDGVKNARYVFLTLREALVNSLVIIGTGCFGFYFIEGFSFIDSWYFTTVLLTVSGLFLFITLEALCFLPISHSISDCWVGEPCSSLRFYLILYSRILTFRPLP